MRFALADAGEIETVVIGCDSQTEIAKIKVERPGPANGAAAGG